ncbi:ATP-dependent DNA helicase II subunit 2 [Cladochytrium tenue]|nr:ATP-dependent DNA helicase II subunit 2 [Cladochytrium tenue]
MAQKEATILVLDVSPSMWAAGASPDDSHLAKATLAIHHILHAKIVGGRKTDLIGVVFVGSNREMCHSSAVPLISNTNNALSQNNEGYERIRVVADIGMVDLDLLKYITYDCEKVVDGIVVAIDMLERHCKKLKWIKQILLFTDGRSDTFYDQIDAIQGKALQYEVKLSVM